MPAPEERKPDSTFLLLADHPALDLLNTVPLVAGQLVDLFQSDQDVLLWLKSASGLEGFGANDNASALKPGTLLTAMRDLREVVRSMVEKHHAGRQFDPAKLNRYLAEARHRLADAS